MSMAQQTWQPTAPLHPHYNALTDRQVYDLITGYTGTAADAPHPLGGPIASLDLPDSSTLVMTAADGRAVTWNRTAGHPFALYVITRAATPGRTSRPEAIDIAPSWRQVLAHILTEAENAAQAARNEGAPAETIERRDELVRTLTEEAEDQRWTRTALAHSGTWTDGLDQWWRAERIMGDQVADVLWWAQ